MEGIDLQVDLSCLCGSGCNLTLLRKTDGNWILGNIEKSCSPLISGKDLQKVFEKFKEVKNQNC